MPNLFDFRDDLNNQNQVSQQNTSITNNQRQAIASESLSKANSLTMKHDIRHYLRGICPVLSMDPHCAHRMMSTGRVIQISADHMITRTNYRALPDPLESK